YVRLVAQRRVLADQRRKAGSGLGTPSPLSGTAQPMHEHDESFFHERYAPRHHVLRCFPDGLRHAPPMRWRSILSQFERNEVTASGTSGRIPTRPRAGAVFPVATSYPSPVCPLPRPSFILLVRLNAFFQTRSQ